MRYKFPVARLKTEDVERTAAGGFRNSSTWRQLAGDIVPTRFSFFLAYDLAAVSAAKDDLHQSA